MRGYRPERVQSDSENAAFTAKVFGRVRELDLGILFATNSGGPKSRVFCVGSKGLPIRTFRLADKKR